MKVLKLLVALFGALSILGMFALLVIQAVRFANDDTIMNTVEWKTADSIMYPNITVCNTKFFSPSRLESMQHFFFFKKKKYFGTII